MGKIRLKYWITSIAAALFICFVAAVAMVHAFVPGMFNQPGEQIPGSEILFGMFKALVIILISYPGIIILSGNADLYQRQLWIARDMEREKKEGPMLFDPQNTRLF